MTVRCTVSRACGSSSVLANLCDANIAEIDLIVVAGEDEVSIRRCKTWMRFAVGRERSVSRGLADASVPMSLLADHPNVRFNYYRGGLGTCAVEMH